MEGDGRAKSPIEMEVKGVNGRKGWMCAALHDASSEASLRGGVC